MLKAKACSKAKARPKPWQAVKLPHVVQGAARGWLTNGLCFACSLLHVRLEHGWGWMRSPVCVWHPSPDQHACLAPLWAVLQRKKHMCVYVFMCACVRVSAATKARCVVVRLHAPAGARRAGNEAEPHCPLAKRGCSSRCCTFVCMLMHMCVRV